MPVYTERGAGNYKATYLGCQDKELTNPDSGELEPRWLWRFQEVGTTTSDGEIAKFTGTSLRSANSNAYKMATGILGHKPQPGDDTEKHVGEVYDVFYGPNQAGNLTIIGVAAVKPADSPVPTSATDKAAAVHAAQEGDELPF